MKDELVLVGKYAVFDEHELPPTPTRKGVKVDAIRLQRIADNSNRRVKETEKTGIPSVIGHTDDEKPESEQPKIVGFWKDFTVEPLFNTGRKALWANHYVYKSKLDEVRNYPRRSVEFWANRDEIDPISLLGATTPERDLGLMLYEKTDDDKPYYYSLENSLMADETKSEGPEMDKLVAAVMQSAPMQQITAAVQKIMQLVEALESEEQEEQTMPPKQEAMKDNNPPPVKFDAASASGTNTTIPSLTEEKKQYQMDEELKIKFSKLEATASNLEKENVKLRNELEAQKLRYQKDNAKTLLEKAKAEKIKFDWEDELALLESIPVEFQPAHYSRMERLYAREVITSPADVTKEVDKAIQFSRSNDGTPTGPKSFNEATQMAEEARKKGLTYDDYLKQSYGIK